MSYKLEDIMHETTNHWVLKTKQGFEIYRVGITHSTRCGFVGFFGGKGLGRAITECNRREAL